MNSDNYGIAGKEIIEPLRLINNKTLILNNIDNNYSVHDFWNWISNEIYSDSIYNSISHKHDLDHTRKYFMINGYRYSINDETKSLLYYLSRMKLNNIVDIQLLLSLNAGTVFNDDGIRYFMNSKEQGEHHVAHVHVDIRHEYSGAFAIEDGKQLTDNYIPPKYVKKIQKKIEENRLMLFHFWNEHTDGLDVDLNQVFGLIEY